MIFEGSGVALVTPFTEAGAVDWAALTRLVDFHLSHHTDALVILGTTGEAATMTEEEKLQVVRQVCKQVDGQLPIIVGVGGNNTQQVVDFSQKVEEYPVDGLLVVTPFYNKTNAEGLYQHFRVIHDATHTPIILYVVPGRTGMTVPVPTVKRLAELARIAGIKDATGDISYAQELRRVLPDDFAIYSGNDELILPYMAIGGNGVISVLANVLPEETHAVAQPVTEKTRQTFLALQPLCRALFLETNPIPVKSAVAHLNLCGPTLRLPLYPATPETEASVFSALDEWTEEA